MSYQIFVDVSCDIDPVYAAENNLLFIPMEYSLGEEMRICKGIESRELLKKFYDGQRGGDLTKTSQISAYMYQEYMEPYFKNGDSALYLCLSGGLSSTFQSASVAQKELKEAYPDQDFLPVDSLAATGGMGVLAERALRNRANGMSLQENYEDMKKAASHIRHWFMVQDLQYLKRGGRLSGATAAVGTLLNVKPILKINETGGLDTFAKKRGNKAAIQELVKNFAETYDKAAGDVIYVIDADAPEIAEILVAEVKKIDTAAVVRRCGLTPIIGAHTGPGMAAICHMGI